MNLRLRCATLFAAVLIAASAAAQSPGSYPEKPVRVIAPFPPASASDNIGRVVASLLTKSLGGSFFLDNRPGASGIIGSELALQAPADGSTLVISSSSTHSVNPWIFKKLPYDPLKSFNNISCLAVLPQVLLVSASSKFHSVSDLAAYGRSHPDELVYAYGTPTGQVASAALSKLAGFRAIGVSYRGASDAIFALVRGDAQFMLSDLSTATSQLSGGKLRALAVSSPNGSPRLPGVPAFKDVGFQEFNMVLWVGLSAPARVSREVSEKIAASLQSSFEDEDAKKRYAEWGIERCAMGQESFERFVREQYGVWRTTIKEMGMQSQ
jgi:tripartite-type tricarboxylate transporter receptor subunit TctC